MYDYLGGEQVKTFHHPIFKLNKEHPECSSFWYSGGSMLSFDEGDELPLKELWYQYPEDFLIYDYMHGEEVWIIGNGKFERIISYKEITPSQITKAVYDYYGRPLQLKTPQDFISIKQDDKLRLQNFKEIQTKFFPDGSIHAIKTNIKYYESKKTEYFKELDQINEAFSEKWLKNNPFEQECNFGAMLECYIFTRSRKDDDPLKDIIIPKDDFEGCRLTLLKMLKEMPDITKRFESWVNNEKMLADIGYQEILDELWFKQT